MDKNNNYEKITKAEEVLNDMGLSLSDVDIKKLKKDKGLFERTESSKIVLVEDNRQILID